MCVACARACPAQELHFVEPAVKLDPESMQGMKAGPYSLNDDSFCECFKRQVMHCMPVTCINSCFV